MCLLPGESCSPADGSDPCGAQEDARLELIDDMEDGDRQVTRGGFAPTLWYAYNDGSDGGHASMEVEPLPTAHCASRFALHLAANGFGLWGSGAGFALRSAADSATDVGFDARAYAGVQFRARSGADVPTTLRLDVDDLHTDPVGGFCNPDLDASDRCYTMFTKTETVTGVWRVFHVAFDSLQQTPGQPGYRAASGLSVGALYGMNWFVPSANASQRTDVWIDDVAWFRVGAPAP